MKVIIKKLAIFLLVLNFVALPLTACSELTTDKEIEGVLFENTIFSYNGEEQSLLVTGELPEGVTATYQNNVHKDYGIYNASCTLSGKGYITKNLNAVMTISYNDNGAFDEDAYAFRNQLSDDTINLNTFEKAGTFSNGKTEILLADKVSIDDNEKTKAGLNESFNSSTSDVDAYYLTTNQLITKSSVLPPYEDNEGYLVLESKKVANQNVYLSLKPSCTKEEFIEADYLEFYMYLDTKSNAKNQPSEMTLYMAGSSLFATDLGAWVKVVLPLDVYLAPRSSNMANFIVPSTGKKGVKSKADFYEYLSAGMPFMRVKTTFRIDDESDKVYKVYFSDLNLKVETPNGDGSRLNNNFTRLNQTQYLSQRKVNVLKNVFPRYVSALYEDDFIIYNDANVVKMDIPLDKYSTTSINTLCNVMYVQVNPLKTFKQISEYDVLAVTLRIESQNPHPYVAMVGVPTQYSTETKELAKFSANKWVTFEIPVTDVLKMYAYLKNTCIYETPGTNYIWSNHVQELFYITYEVNEKDYGVKNDKPLIYAKDVYADKARENNSVWSTYPSRDIAYEPGVQGNWVQYPMTLYLKSLKLIKK